MDEQPENTPLFNNKDESQGQGKKGEGQMGPAGDPNPVSP